MSGDFDLYQAILSAAPTATSFAAAVREVAPKLGLEPGTLRTYAYGRTPLDPGRRRLLEQLRLKAEMELADRAHSDLEDSVRRYVAAIEAAHGTVARLRALVREVRHERSDVV